MDQSQIEPMLKILAEAIKYGETGDDNPVKWEGYFRYLRKWFENNAPEMLND